MRWERCPPWFVNGRKQLEGIHGISGLLGVIRKTEKDRREEGKRGRRRGTEQEWEGGKRGNGTQEAMTHEPGLKGGIFGKWRGMKGGGNG